MADAFEKLGSVLHRFAGPAPDDLYAGAVALIAHDGSVRYHRAFGSAQSHDRLGPLGVPREMSTDTAFDLASITKVAATTVAVLKLVDDGLVSLDEPAANHLPALARGEKGRITLRHLLTHRAGLAEWQPTYLHAQDRESALAHVQSAELRYPVGAGRHYSDLGFMLLGAVVEAVTGQRLDHYVADRIHRPLGMSSTLFNPPPDMHARIAATSRGNAYEFRMIETGSPHPPAADPRTFAGWRDYPLVGEVNDGNAWHAFGGVAGHAGLFGTAQDLAVLGQTLINDGRHGTTMLASANMVAAFLHEPYDSGQAVGFLGDRLSVVGATGGYGHSGFTGTEFLFDPQRELVAVLLTNRLHPDRSPRSLASPWHAVLRAALAATGAGQRPR